MNIMSWMENWLVEEMFWKSWPSRKKRIIKCECRSTAVLIACIWNEGCVEERKKRRKEENNQD
jgi:hypothetical protein